MYIACILTETVYQDNVLLTNQDLINQYNDLEECILMGFPETSDDILVLNCCILYTIY